MEPELDIDSKDYRSHAVSPFHEMGAYETPVVRA